MVILSYWLFPLLLLTTLHIQKIQNEFYKIKYFNSTLISIIGAVFLCILYFDKFNYAALSFLGDYRFYLAQVLSIIFMILQIKSRKANEHNLTICYFINFLSIAIVPFTSIIIISLFTFNNTIEIEYKNSSDVYLLSISLLVLSVFFYLDKLKNKSVNNIGLLISIFFMGAFSGVFAGKMMQEYNPFLYMTVATIFNIGIFFLISLFKEKNSPQKLIETVSTNKKSYLILSFGYCVTLYLNIIIISNLPVEYYSIIRNVGIILMNYIYAYVFEKINLFNVKDSIILILIITALIHFTI